MVHSAHVIDVLKRQRAKSLLSKLSAHCAPILSARWTYSEKSKVALIIGLKFNVDSRAGQRHILQIVDVYQDQRHFYIVTELMRGGVPK